MRVILDCDPGNGIPAADIDDGLALGLALRSPEIELEAVTIVAGNTARDTGVAIANTVLDVAGANVPVYAGAAAPLVEDPRPWRTDLDGRSEEQRAVELWQGVPRPYGSQSPAGDDAAGEIVRRVAGNPGQITLVAVGPLTNVAQALSRRPELAREVARIVVMGGAFAVPGMLQELNFGYDPEAAHQVLSSGAPVTIVPFDVTRTTCMHSEDAEHLAAAGTALAGYLADTSRPWIRWIEEVRGLPGCHLHDPLALVVLLAPELVTSEWHQVDVELRGTLTRSRPIAWRPDRAERGVGLRLPDVEPVEVLTGVDNEAFVSLLLERLSR